MNENQELNVINNNINVDNNISKLGPHNSLLEELNVINNNINVDNTINKLDPHNRLLEELRNKLSNISYDFLSDFVGMFYLIEGNQNITPIPEFHQAHRWNMELGNSLSQILDIEYFMKNGIKPQEFISTAYDVYIHYNDFNRTEKSIKH